MTTKQLIKKIAGELLESGVTPTNLFNDDLYERVNYILEKENFFTDLEDEMINQFQNESRLQERNRDYFGNRIE